MNVGFRFALPDLPTSPDFDEGKPETVVKTGAGTGPQDDAC